MTRAAAALLAVAVVACTHDYVAGAPEPGAEGSGGATSTTSGSSGPSTGASGSVSHGGEGGSEGSSSGASEGGSTSTGFGSNGPQVSALFVPGGIDRIRVFELEPSLDWCTIITVANIGANTGDIDAPLGWSVESVVLSDVGSDCDGLDSPTGTTTNATTTAGSLSWTTPPSIPCELDIEVELTFDAPWAPPGKSIQANAVPVDNCS